MPDAGAPLDLLPPRVSRLRLQLSPLPLGEPGDIARDLDACELLPHHDARPPDAPPYGRGYHGCPFAARDHGPVPPHRRDVGVAAAPADWQPHEHRAAGIGR